MERDDCRRILSHSGAHSAGGGGGQGGIRTHDGVSPMPVFKTGAINRSATCPARRANDLADTAVRAKPPIPPQCRRNGPNPSARRASTQGAGGIAALVLERLRVPGPGNFCPRRNEIIVATLQLITILDLVEAPRHVGRNQPLPCHLAPRGSDKPGGRCRRICRRLGCLQRAFRSRSLDRRTRTGSRLFRRDAPRCQAAAPGGLSYGRGRKALLMEDQADKPGQHHSAGNEKDRGADH